MHVNSILVVFAALLVVYSAGSLSAASNRKWKIGEPIVTYWAGPSNFMELDDRAAEQITSGGWNLGWAKDIKELDIYYKHGIRAMLIVNVPDINDPVQAKALDEKIRSVRKHPAMYAYHILDEPGASAFPMLGRLVDFIKQRDPDHLAYINLLPTYANNDQLGTKGDWATAYREHLALFIKEVKPELLSYDHYHFNKTGDSDQYFLNLALVREAAVKAKIPFLNIIQAMECPCGWRQPTEHEMRWLTYTTLAYGALGISHFRYDAGFFVDPATPKPLYWQISRINRDFLAIAKEIQALKSIGAYHCGELPMGATALPQDSPFRPDDPSQNILLGYFGKNSKSATHVLVVNLDYRNSVSTDIVCPRQVEVFHTPTQSWFTAQTKKLVKLDIAPGGGTLIRLKNR